MSFHQSLKMVLQQPHKWLGLPFNLLLFIFAIALMLTVSDLRLRELRIALLQNDEVENNFSARDDLVYRFKLLRQKQRNFKNVGDESILDEAKILSILNSSFSDPNLFLKKDNFLEKPLIFLMNSLNNILGSESYLGKSKWMVSKYLQAAHFFERKKQFKKAASVYSIILENKFASQREIIYAHLHLAYCNALIGHYQQTYKSIQYVLKNGRGDSLHLARELKSLIFKVHKKIKKLEQEKPSFQKGVELFNSLAYVDSITVFQQLLKSALGLRRIRIYYYLAKAYEESGSVQLAEKYYNLIMKSGSTKYSKAANKRLYLVNNFFLENKSSSQKENKIAVKFDDAEITKVEKLKISLNTPLTLKATIRELRPVLDKIESEKRLNIEAVRAVNVNEKELAINKIYNSIIIAKNVDKRLLSRYISQERRMDLLQQEKTINKIHTKEGSILTGLILKKTKAKIRFLTFFGQVDIPLKEIQKIEIENRNF